MINIEEAALQYCSTVLDNKTHACPVCGEPLDVTPLSGAVGICCAACRLAVVCRRGGGVKNL